MGRIILDTQQALGVTGLAFCAGVGWHLSGWLLNRLLSKL